MAQRRSAYEILQIRDDAHQLIVKAAYRVLAGIYHPDTNREAGTERRMAEVNAAYAEIRTPERREAYDRLLKAQGSAQAPSPGPVVTPPPAPRPASGANGVDATLDFGRYAGWSLRDLARQDPDYLRWLSRHSSGIRYRARIEELLRSAPSGPTMSERVRGR
jgi:DnaJ-class molecular chaperone